MEQMLTHSQDVELEVIDPLQRAVDPADEICALLGSEDLMCIRVCRLRAGLAFGHSVIHVPASVGRRLNRVQPLTRRGGRSSLAVIAMLERAWGRPVTSVRQEVSLDRIGRSAAPLIGCRPGQLVLRIDHLFTDADGVPVELAVNRFNPARYVYRVDFRRTLQN